MSPRLRLLVAFATVYVVWGSTYVAIRFVVESAPPLLAMGARFLAAGLLLLAWARWRGTPWPTTMQWRGALIVGALLFLAGNGGVAWAEARGLPSGTASLLVATMPLWLTGLGLLQGERPPRSAWVGLAIGFAGTALLVRPDSGASSSWPALVVAMGAACWASGSLLARRVAVPADMRMGSAIQMIAGGFLLALAGIAGGESLPSSISTASAIAWIYLVVFGSIVAFTAYGWLLRHVAPAKVGTYAYVNPVVAVLLGALVGESLDGTTIVAMLLVLGGVAVTIAARGRTTRVVAPPLRDEGLARPARS